MRADRRARRRWDVRSVEARLAVDLGGVHGRGGERLGAAGGDRNVDPGELQDRQGVARRVGERGVAVDGCHGEEIEVARCEQDRDRIVVTGVAIDQDLGSRPGHRGPCPVETLRQASPLQQDSPRRVARRGAGKPARSLPHRRCEGSVPWVLFRLDVVRWRRWAHVDRLSARFRASLMNEGCGQTLLIGRARPRFAARSAKGLAAGMPGRVWWPAPHPGSGAWARRFLCLPTVQRCVGNPSQTAASVARSSPGNFILS